MTPPAFPASCLRTYRPEEPLGSGGYGTVWLATHIELKRRVALKLLNHLPDDEEDALARFRDEARIAATLQHPSIVKVLDHGVDDAQPWIVFEYVEGPGLRDLLDRGPLTVPVAVGIAQQMAGALAEAHRHGVLHRDLKPDNILMGTDATAKLTDFGIAKWKRGTAQATAPQVVLGSPAYIAPERILGEELGPASDLYALGVMLFEMLTGDPPFRDLDAQEVFRQQLHTPPPRLRTKRPDAPAALDALVARLLEKDPARRPKDAAAIERALESISCGDNSRSMKIAKPPSAAVRRAAWPAGLAVGLLAAVLALVAPRVSPRPAPSASTGATRHTTADAALEVQLSRFQAAVERLAAREALLEPSAPVTASTEGALKNAVATANADLAVWHESIVLGNRLPGARAHGWSGAGLAARARGFAFLHHVQQRRLQVPGAGALLDEPGGLLLAEYLDLLPADLARALDENPRGDQLLADMLGDVPVISRAAYALEPLPRAAAQGIKRFRNGLAERPGPLPALVRALWEHGKKADVLKGAPAETWSAVSALRAQAPDLPGGLFADRMDAAVRALVDREARHERDIDVARRRWLVQGDPPARLLEDVKTDLELVAGIERALGELPGQPPAAAALLAVVRVRTLGVHLRLYTALDRLTQSAATKEHIGIATIAFRNAANLLDRAQELRPTRVPLLTRYLDELARALEAIAAGGPMVQVDLLMLDLLDLARRARWTEPAATDKARAALEAWRERVRHLEGRRGRALAAIAEGYWQVGLARKGQALKEAMDAHFDALGDAALYERTRNALSYARPVITLPERSAGRGAASPAR